MIFSRNSNDDEHKVFVRGLCDAFDGAVWIVFRPQFINLGSEAENGAREIEFGAGESAFQLSSAELSELVMVDAIGFDWTDLCICDERVPVLYLQCVDSTQWYAKTDNFVAKSMLLRLGFVESSLISLPFAEQMCP